MALHVVGVGVGVGRDSGRPGLRHAWSSELYGPGTVGSGPPLRTRGGVGSSGTVPRPAGRAAPIDGEWLNAGGRCVACVGTERTASLAWN